MYVIMDMEWIESHGGVPCPTQIAALRVDRQWRRSEVFNSLIRPRDKSCHHWDHMAYTGAEREQFQDAPSGISVFRALFQWLRDDDVLLWWEKHAALTFVNAVRHMLNRELSQPVRLLRPTVVKACGGKGSPCQLAASRGILIPEPQHVSANDVETLRRLLEHLGIRPESIHDSPKPKAKASSPDIMKYLYDPATNLLHTADGGCQVENPSGYATFKGCLRKGFRPCPVCLAKDYRREFMKVTNEVISRTEYNFVYQAKSKVFHKAECVHARRIPYWEVRGSVNYYVCTELGKRPCRLCNPTKNYHRPRVLLSVPAVVPTLPKKPRPTPLPGLTRILNADETRAYNRHLEAAQRRSSIAPAFDTIAQEDEYKRSCSGFMFWAARGYKSFHRANCPKLKGLANLEGFSHFKHATGRGFTPCKLCKPSPKDDLVISVPSGSAIRPNETTGLLDHLCGEYGYRHSRDEWFYYINTPVGKWKLDITARPIDLWHINLVNNPNADYHRQPRLILSLSDAFWYIHRHDKTLLERMPVLDDIDAVIRQMDDELRQLGAL